MIVLRLQKYISVMSGHVRKLGERSPPCPQPKEMFFLRCRMFCNGNIYILLKNFAKYIDLGLFVGWRECLTWDSWKGFVFLIFYQNRTFQNILNILILILEIMKKKTNIFRCPQKNIFCCVGWGGSESCGHVHNYRVFFNTFPKSFFTQYIMQRSLFSSGFLLSFHHSYYTHIKRKRLQHFLREKKLK